MKMQKAPLPERLSKKQTCEKTKYNTPIVSVFDNEAQVSWQSAKTFARATVQGVAA